MYVHVFMSLRNRPRFFDFVFYVCVTASVHLPSSVCLHRLSAYVCVAVCVAAAA